VVLDSLRDLDGLLSAMEWSIKSEPAATNVTYTNIKSVGTLRWTKWEVFPAKMKFGFM
jgi:hypothetical protein